jgi:hypothetical protein
LRGIEAKQCESTQGADVGIVGYKLIKFEKKAKSWERQVFLEFNSIVEI